MASEHNFLYAYLVRQLRTKEYFRLFLIEGYWNIPNNKDYETLKNSCMEKP